MEPHDEQEAPAPEHDDEFRRFERLTRYLLKVPKAAIDAERKKGDRDARQRKKSA